MNAAFGSRLDADGSVEQSLCHLALWDRAMGVAIDIDSLLHRVT
ncbi:hypothetical protein [Pseudomonas entomophila]|nr:hypothetical protein [Pseudomonas entomophila]